MDAYRLQDADKQYLTLKQVEWTVKRFKSHRRITYTFDKIVEEYETAHNETL